MRTGKTSRRSSENPTNSAARAVQARPAAGVSILPPRARSSGHGFLIVDYRSEISARGSPRSGAVKIAEDDVAAWATHAAIRAVQKRLRK
jgi:hypothetical protein